jgi:hypothetical protein
VIERFCQEPPIPHKILCGQPETEPRIEPRIKKNGAKEPDRENGAETQVAYKKGITAMVRIGIVGVGFMGMIHYHFGQYLKKHRKTC